MDRVRAFKLETPAEGGTQTDVDHTEVDPGQDWLDCQGITMQEPGSVTNTSDEKVYTSRLGGALRLTDVPSGTLALGQLLTSVTGKPGSHNVTPDVIHWLADGGPGDGFAPGAVFSTQVQGAVVVRETWWASAAKQVPLYDVVYQYQGLLLGTVTRRLYAGGQLARTVVDTYTYGTVFAPQITRTWS